MSCEKKRISIIIPFYNEEKDIERCLESIRNNIFDSCEIIMVDDGSTDGSTEICRKYLEKDRRFKLFVQENKGRSAARNYGLEQASGDWIWFIDADDKILQGSLNYYGTILEEDSFDMVVAQYAIPYNNYQCNFEGLKTTKEYLEDEALHRDGFYYCVLWNKLFKRSIICDNNVRFDEYASKWGEDNLFVLAYVMYCRNIKYISVKVYDYIPPNEGGQVCSIEKQKYIFAVRCMGLKAFRICLDKYECSKESQALAKDQFYLEAQTDLIEMLKDKKKQALVKEIWNSKEFAWSLSKDDKDKIKRKELFLARICYKLKLKYCYLLYLKIRYCLMKR